jgi:hypothetical protein
MAQASLKWASANVKNAKLTVELEGEIPRGWRQSFETTARLLGSSGEWGDVSVGKKGKTVSVSDVTEGSEAKLRHYLESVVEQANAAHPPQEPEDEEADEDTEDRDDDGADAQMAERFRSFAD